MEDLVITPSQKAQLHEVADLMLEIYRTLARMRYLDPSWIREGPHDISVLLPMYHSHGLDATVIYLYGILPYVDTGGAENVDFFQGGEFADFRLDESVERGRDPFYEGEDEVALRPWMTPLSLLGNHQSVIIYDAKKHCIGIFDQESGGSTDHNLWAVVQETSEGGEGAGEEKEEAGEDGENSQDEEEGEDEEDEDEDGDEDEDEDMKEDEDEEDGEGPYDEMDSRPAANVLRDIIRWYHELIETPGGGQHSGGEWDAELVKPLYRKHGWPHDNFDGDAFLVDQARAAAAASAKWSAEEPLHEVAKYRGWLEDDDSPAMRQRRDRLGAAQTVDEEWVARWELWQAEQRNRHVRKKLHEAEEVRDRECPNGQCQKPEDLPLWELRQLRINSWEKQRTLEATQQEAAKETETGEPEGVPGIQLRLRHAEKQAATYHKAYEASRINAERLCPGRQPFTLGLGVETSGLDLEERMANLTSYIEDSQSQAAAIQDWMAQLPADGTADQARKLAQEAVNKKEQYIETCMEQCRGVALSLEKGV